MGLFKSLLNAGVAYAQHITAVRKAIALPEADAITNLSSYIRGLSDASFLGFKIAVGGMQGKETDPVAKQSLKWIVENADALRRGQFENLPVQHVATPKPTSRPAAVFSFQDTIRRIEPWFAMSETQRRAQLNTALTQMNEGERELFIVHLNTAVQNCHKELQKLQNNEQNAWGNSYEDRMAYGLAKLKSGTSDPTYAKEFAEGQRHLHIIESLTAEATNWRPPTSAPAKRAAQSPPSSAAPVITAAALENERLKKLGRTVQTKGFNDEAFVLLEQELEASIADGRVPEDRVFALKELLAEIRSVADASRAGELTSEQVVGEFKRIYAQRQELFSTAGHHLVKNNSACERAQALLGYLQEIKTVVGGDLMGMRSESTRTVKHNLTLRVSRVIDHLTKLKDDAAVTDFERTEVRLLALAVRQATLQAHLTLAYPLWDCPPQDVASSQVFFVGSDDVRSLMVDVCKQKQLKLETKVDARSYGQARWNTLRGSAVAVFDWRQYEPERLRQDQAAVLKLAAIAYEQGLSIVLGIPAVVLANTGQYLPFDIEIEPLVLNGNDKKHNRAALDEALDTAIYGLQRRSAESGLTATANWLNASLVGHPERQHFEGMGWLDPKHLSDPAAFGANVSYMLSLWGEQAPVTLFPSWPADYPANGTGGKKRLFHVMPFTQPWSNDAKQSAADICAKKRVMYERGDTSSDNLIVRRVWQGICTADFVLADITGFNPNVMLEIGMAHALGRKTLLVEQADNSGKVRNLEKIDIAKYRTFDELQTIVDKWLSEGRKNSTRRR